LSGWGETPIVLVVPISRTNCATRLRTTEDQCDIFRDDAGLIAAIVVGLAVRNLPGFDVPARRPFFATLVQSIIGVLFISISATVTPASVRDVVLPTLVLAAILIIVARPLVAFLCTVRTDLPAGERRFVGWMTPSGIIAAATASTFSATLAHKGVAGASRILPAAHRGGRLQRPGVRDTADGSPTAAWSRGQSTSEVSCAFAASPRSFQSR
jgi:hypothetical protein